MTAVRHCVAARFHPPIPLVLSASRTQTEEVMNMGKDGWLWKKITNPEQVPSPLVKRIAKQFIYGDSGQRKKPVESDRK
jgi:hypothetical protein